MYLVDTNILGQLDAVYPADVFPSLWDQLETRIFAADVFFHHKVDKELRRWKHPRLAWYVQHIDVSQILFTDDAEVQRYYELTAWATHKRVPAYRSAAVDEFLWAADSWIVASATRHGATIVTNEVPAPQSGRKVKIPDAAAAFGVPCVNSLAFLRSLKVSV